VEVSIEAVETVPSDLLHVHIGGRGKDDYVSTLKKRHSTTNVTFHGYVDPSTFLPSLDVLVVPSLWREPLGRVVFEAFAHGVPVIGANRGGIPEMIDEGTTGYVFDPSDVDSLRASLVQLARSPSLLQPMRDAAYEESRRYRPETVMSEYLEVYTRLRSGVPEST
jgi:glycosyltransferase involved in cell wall biosynthesis